MRFAITVRLLATTLMTLARAEGGFFEGLSDGMPDALSDRALDIQDRLVRLNLAR